MSLYEVFFKDGNGQCHKLRVNAAGDKMAKARASLTARVENVWPEPFEFYSVERINL